MIANLSHIAFVITLVPREQAPARVGGHPAERTAAVLAATRNAVPVRVQLLTSPGGILCNPPPWGTLAAVDLTSGDVRWEVPLGRTPELSAVPEAPLGLAELWWHPHHRGRARVHRGGARYRAARLRRRDGHGAVGGGPADECPGDADDVPVGERQAVRRDRGGGHTGFGTNRGDHVAFALP